MDLNGLLIQFDGECKAGEMQSRRRRHARRAITTHLHKALFMPARPLRVFVQGSAQHNTSILVTTETSYDLDLVACFGSGSSTPLLHNLSARKCLENLRDSLRTVPLYGGIVGIPRDTCVQLKGFDGFSIDVVPAFSTVDDGIILVPKFKQDEWVKNTPELHNDWCKELNRVSKGLFSRTVRYVKWWKLKVLSTRKHPSSLDIELMVGAALCKYLPTSDIHSLMWVFRYMRDTDLCLLLANPRLPDEKLYREWGDFDKSMFRNAVEAADKLILEAIDGRKLAASAVSLGYVLGPQFRSAAQCALQSREHATSTAE